MAVVNDRHKQNKGKSETDFRTPPEVFNYCQNRFGIYNLDVAASNENALCSAFFSIEGDALNRSWGIHRVGSRVWCNPPYNHIGPWVDKALSEIEKGKCKSVTFIVPASTCTKWFKLLWDSIYCSNIIFITGRLNFLGPHVHPDQKKASATNPSVIIHLEGDLQGMPSQPLNVQRIDRGDVK